MQRRLVTVLVVLLVGGVLMPEALAGDTAAKAAAHDLSEGYQAAKRGYWQEAQARYEHASIAQPGNAEVWSNLAVSLEAVGRYDEAGDAYLKALKIDPGNRRIRQNYSLFTEFYASFIAPDVEEDVEVGFPVEGEEMTPEEGEETGRDEGGDTSGEGGGDASR